MDTRNRPVRRRALIALAACSMVFLAAACSQVVSGASAPPPTIVPVTFPSSNPVSGSDESSSAVSSSAESSSSQESLPPISSGDTPTASSSFTVDTSGLTAITEPTGTPTSTSVPTTPTTPSSTATKTTPSTTKTTPSTTKTTPSTTTTTSTGAEEHNYIKFKAKGGTITIDFPLCAKAESANGGNAQRYACDDIKNMVSFVYVDLTAQPKLNTAQFNQSVKTWFGKDVYKATSDKTDPLVYTSSNKSIPLAKLFDTSKTKQTYKVSYFNDTTTKQYILFGEVSNPKGGWAEFDVEIPATAKASKYIMNSDWGVLAIGISDALHSHAH